MKRAGFALLMLLVTGAFLWLGVWQVERRSWKLDLIARTEQKLAAAPVAAPAPASWAGLTPLDTYTKVTVEGHYLVGKDTLVVASTRYGRGFWVLTPLQAEGGVVVLINRGFISSAQKGLVVTPAGQVRVGGLLRLTEPKGSLLQANDAAHDRWYSRDVQAIATRHNLPLIAPYFVDADGAGEALPVGGLTVVQFPNSHLQYALTWFGLALLSLLSIFIILKRP